MSSSSCPQGFVLSQGDIALDEVDLIDDLVDVLFVAQGVSQILEHTDDGYGLQKTICLHCLTRRRQIWRIGSSRSARGLPGRVPERSPPDQSAAMARGVVRV